VFEESKQLRNIIGSNIENKLYGRTFDIVQDNLRHELHNFFDDKVLSPIFYGAVLTTHEVLYEPVRGWILNEGI
jgi:hypothetical protein